MQRPMRIVLGALAAALVGGCATAPTCPAHGGDAWHEVTSRHFVLHTDLGPREAREATADFERQYLMLEDVAFPGYEDVPGRIEVVLFAGAADYRRFEPWGTGGVFYDHFPVDLERAPTMVLHARLDDETRIVITHELTHRFMRRAMRPLPPWLNEGFADYYSVVHVDDGQAIFGDVVPFRRIAPDRIPSVEAIVSATPSAFYAASFTNSTDGAALLTEQANYAGAFALVHFLRTGPDAYRARFDQLLDDLDAGATPERAWARFARGFDPSRLEADFRRHVDAESWPRFGGPVTLRPVPSPGEARVLRDAEVHVLWARLLAAREATRGAARAQLAEASLESPDDADVRFWRGRIAMLDGDVAAATAHFDAILARRPTDARALLAAMVVRKKTKENEPQIAPLAARLRAVAQTPDELTYLAAYALDHDDDLASARELASAALRADPGYWKSLAVDAAVRFRAGEVDEAQKEQERAILHLPERELEPRLVRELQTYRAAAARARAHASP